MEINLFEKLAKDEFFIGSYPDAFAVGRWFSVDELKNTTYQAIEAEYLAKYNPYHEDELELGIFDVENYSGLWRGEQSVTQTIKLLNKIEKNSDIEIDFEYFEFTDENVNELFATPLDAVNAFRFGKINWTHEYLTFDAYGNFESMNQAGVDDAVVNEMQYVFDQLAA